MNYRFKTKPFKHQLKALEESWNRQVWAWFMEMGTGKSKVAIDTIGILHMMEKINAAFIVAPKGVYDNWVKGEIPTHLPDDVDRQIMRWTPANTKKYQDEMWDFLFSEFRIRNFYQCAGTKSVV